MKAEINPGVGLGGDGDEIAAVEAVERLFGVKLDCSNASAWRTAGDVYRALLHVLPAEDASKPDTWERFAQALTRETGVDPKSITPDSVLIAGGFRWGRIAEVNAAIWIALIVAVVGTAAIVWLR